MYKDKDRQREAVREATRRYRANKQGGPKQHKVSQVSHNEGITSESVTVSQGAGVIPKEDRITIPLTPTHTVDLAALRQMKPKKVEQPKSQSHNPMMVGYVPPKE